MAGKNSGDDSQHGSPEILSHSEGECNVKNIQDLLSQLLVAASKMKESQPPVEGIQSGLRECAGDSEWRRNLWWGNCKVLLRLLKVNPCLVVQRRCDGYTVLHAAAEGGCKELVCYVYDILFKSETGKFVDEQSGINITWEEFVDAKHGPWEARAVDYALHSDPGTFFEFFSKVPHRSDWASCLQTIRSSSTPSQVNSDDVEASNHLVEIMQEKSTKELFKCFSKGYAQGAYINPP